MCGGTPTGSHHALWRSGLSPRVRGNLEGGGAGRTPDRSIPACAGEPTWRVYGSWSTPVYPRVCGGTRGESRSRSRLSGLSPRVRGNHKGADSVLVGRGSIPACAGEPLLLAARLAPHRVYPRVCGGTGETSSVGLNQGGLSPRVRGNPVSAGRNGDNSRSIPACAGEPTIDGRRERSARVYPRVCGGTLQSADVPSPRMGLSPRVRGNQPRLWLRGFPVRSIPACAGEPRRLGTM